MFDDELDDDPSGAGGPIHPDDRLWRHPSEVGSAGLGNPAGPTVVRHPSAAGRIWAVAVLAGLTGAAVALTTMAVTGRFSTTVIERESTITPVSATLTQVSSPKTTRRIIDDTAAVMAQITVTADGAQRRGSGVVVRADGAILTTATLVHAADSVTVTLADGRIATGRVAGTDLSTGLAVVRVPLAGLPVATPDRTTAEPGDSAMIVAGAASQDEKPWVSRGVVSAVDRQAVASEHTLSGLIETDSPVPESADGSALVADDGTVSGLCVAVEPETTSGYAVPIAVADAVAGDLLTYGKARRAWLGVEGDDLSAAEATKLGVAGGAVLASIQTDSPAASAGLRAGDVVTAVAGRPVRSMPDLIALLPLHRPDEQVAVTLYRAGTRRTLPVTLGLHP